MHVIAGDGGFHLIFQAGLNRSIQCQDQAVTFRRSDIFFIGKRHIHLVIAFGGDDFPGGALQIAVVGRLHALSACIGGVGEPDDLGCQAAVGIIPLGIGLQMDAGNTVFIDIGTDLGGRILADPCRHLLIAHFGIRRLFLDPGGI